jgi:hypothetical protein
MTAMYIAPHPAMESQGLNASIRPILGEPTTGFETADRRDGRPSASRALETEMLAWEYFVNELEFE